MSKIGKIRESARNGLYYLTEHANREAAADGFDVYDVEYALLKMEEYAGPGRAKGNTKLLASQLMGERSGSSFVRLRAEKFESSQFTKIVLKSIREG